MAGLRGGAGAAARAAAPATAARLTDNANSVSKRSAVEVGYYADPLVARFAGLRRRTALVNRGYWLRFLAMEGVVQWFLDVFGKCERCQVVSLGAGFDTTFFRLAAARRLPESLRYVELDFEATIRAKLELVRNDPDLSALVDGTGTSDDGSPAGSAAYAARGADLRDLAAVERALLSPPPEGAGLDPDHPTLLLSEVALTYLPTSNVDELLRWVAQWLRRPLLAVYEQVIPSDGFGQVMAQHFESVGSPLFSLRVHPTAAAQALRHRACGLEPIGVLDMNELLESVLAKERGRALGLEPFDEFEEWRLTCGHYALVCSAGHGLGIAGGLGPLDRQLPFGMVGLPVEPLDQKPRCRTVTATLLEGGLCRRFGHCACLLGNTGWAIAFGGSGPDQAGKHGRRATVQAINLGRDEQSSFEVLEGRRLHVDGPMLAACVRIPSGVLLLGGRTAPMTSGAATAASGSLGMTLLELQAHRGLPAALADAAVRPFDMPDGAAMPAPRWRHTAVALEGPGVAAGLVLLFGGRDAGTVHGDVWMLDAPQGRWHQLLPEGPAPEPRHSHAAVALPVGPALPEAGNWVPVMLMTGGLDEAEEFLDDAFLLELRAPLQLGGPARWTRLGTSGRLRRRFGHSLHVWRGRAVLFGGVVAASRREAAPALGEHEAHLEWWELPGGEQTHVHEVRLEPLSVEPASPRAPFLPQGHSSVLMGDELFVLGGGGTCYSFGIHVNAHVLRIPLMDVVSRCEVEKQAGGLEEPDDGG